MKMIVAVSAGQLHWKKDFSNIRKHIHYLNYGLLGLATIIKTFGHREIKVFQCEGTVMDLISDIISVGIKRQKKGTANPVSVGDVSFYQEAIIQTLQSLTHFV